MERVFFLAASLAVACSFGSGSAGSDIIQPDTCVTAGGSYVRHFVEETGTCGNLPDMLYVGLEETIPTDSCAGTTITGCTVHGSDCRYMIMSSVSCLLNYSITFASDGSNASGLATMKCVGSGACTSTYQVTYERP